MAEPKKKRYQGYDKQFYLKHLQKRAQPIQINIKAEEMGLTKEAVAQAAKEFDIAVNAWWNAAAVYVINHPEVIRKLVKQVV